MRMLAPMRMFASRLAALFERRGRDETLNAELEFHLQMEVEANRRLGLTPEESRRRALIALGGLDQTKEEHRAGHSLVFFENLLKDVSFAWRMIVHEPRFAATLILVLALGIGCATTMFSVLDRLVLRPISSPVADRLVAVPSTGGAGINPEYWEQNRALDGIGVLRLGDTNLRTATALERAKTVLVSANMFSLMEVQTLFGRTFTPQEETAGHNQVAILGYERWQRSYGGDRAVLGRSVTLNGIAHTIVGVMPAGFRFPPQTDVWVPFVRRGRSLDIDYTDYLRTYIGGWIGRLRPGATLQQAQAGYAVLFAPLVEEERRAGRGIPTLMLPRRLQDRLAGGLRLPLLTLFGATALVLAISCANAASLLVARAAVRRKEIALRVCLGAGRLRIMRQLITESLLIATAAGGLGALVSFAAVNLTRLAGARYMPGLAEVSINARVLAFALGVSVLAGIALGLLPALQSFAPDINRALKQEGARTSGSVRQIIRKALVAGQVALGVVLLVGAALMLQSFYRLTSVQTGFKAEGIITGRVNLPSSRYSTVEQTTGYWMRLREEISRVPGVAVTSFATCLPFTTGGGQPLDLLSPHGIYGRYTWALQQDVTPEYFRALEIPLLAGRAFAESDGPNAPKVLLINQHFARTGWPGENPVGQKVRVEGENETREIAGVVGTVKYWGLEDTDRPQYYLPYFQPFRVSKGGKQMQMRLAVRTSSDPESRMAAIQKAVLSVDLDVPLVAPQTMENVISDSVAAPRYQAWLLAGFGFMALLLAALGVYGVVSYSVACRRHEIGVRVSIGAQRGDILRLVVSEGIRLGLIGVLAGLLGALVLTRLVSTLLFRVEATDTISFVAAPMLLLAAALAASLIPAYRATRLDPLVALRHE